MNAESHPDVVTDPVAHISISGVHGRAELEQRLRHAAPRADARRDMLLHVLLGAAAGAVAVLLFRR